MDRRTFLGTCSLLPVAVPALADSVFASLYSQCFHTVVYDTQFKECRRFAKEAQTHGLTISAIEDDVTDLWYSHLYHYWKSGGSRPIAGLTTPQSAFCLGLLARDAGFYRVFHGLHRQDAEGVISHKFSGDQSQLTEIINNKDEWSIELARNIATGEFMKSIKVSRVDPTLAYPLQSSDYLVSWVLARLT